MKQRLIDALGWPLAVLVSLVAGSLLDAASLASSSRYLRLAAVFLILYSLGIAWARLSPIWRWYRIHTMHGVAESWRSFVTRHLSS
jgi:hypothetical protein